MATKTTSGSGFHFLFRFSMVDLVDNATNHKNDPLHFFEKFDLNVEKFEKYLNELREFPMGKFFICCSRRGPQPLCQNSPTFIKE